jgi:hypothetical protein
MASLAVSVAEQEPALVHNGKLNVLQLVRWATRWVQERRSKRRTADSFYEESAVQMMHKEQAAKQREAREAPDTAAAGAESKSRDTSVGLTPQAVHILMQNADDLPEVLPPLEAESIIVRELTGELQQRGRDTYGEEAELPQTKALLALEASRYLRDASGWPTVAGALRCLQRRKGPPAYPCESQDQFPPEGGGKAGKDERDEHGRPRRAGEDNRRHGHLLLTREAMSLLGRVESGELRRRPPIGLGEGRISDLVTELIAVTGAAYKEAATPLTPQVAVAALDASRYLLGGADQPTVAGAFRCLQRSEQCELWRMEVEQIAQQTGMTWERAREAREEMMKGDPNVRDVVTATVQKYGSQATPAQNRATDKEGSEQDPKPRKTAKEAEGQSACRNERASEGTRQDRSSSESEGEAAGMGKAGGQLWRRENCGLKRGKAELEASEGKSGGNHAATGQNRLVENDSGHSRTSSSHSSAERAEDTTAGEAETPSGKRRRVAEPLPRGVRRLVTKENRRAQQKTNPRNPDPSRLNGLNRLQRSRVEKRGRKPAEKELAQHRVTSRVAERMRRGRQEDLHYALDQYRRQQQGMQLTAVDRDWAALGATLSPAKVLGYGAGAVAATDGQIEDANDDEFELMLEAILEQYDCSEERAIEALEETADDEGWNVDAAINRLVEAGVEPWPADDGTGTDDSESGTDENSEQHSDENSEALLEKGNEEEAATEGVRRKKIKKFHDAGGVQDGASPKALQLRYRARSSEPRAPREDDEPRSFSQKDAHSPRRISAAGEIRDLRGYELQVNQLRKVIDCDDATARLLLMDKRSRATAGGIPDVAKAVRLYYEGQNEGVIKKGNGNTVESELSKVRTAAGTLHSMVLPSLPLPDWDVGKAPEGGFTYPTFRRVYALFQKYQRQTNFATTVTLKSLVTAQLRPTIEARCGITKDAWKEVTDGGMDDHTFIQKVQDTLKPVRAMEFEVLFEGMKLKHPGNETDILATVEEWGEKWLSTEREAEEQGITLQPGKMKELFKKAVAPISRVSRLILGEQFKSTAEWYSLIIRELRLRQSYAAEADRDTKKRESPYSGSTYRGSTRGGGRGGFGSGRFFGARQGNESDNNHPDQLLVTCNNHSGGSEPMVYQPAGRGRGSPRGRGGGQWTSRGGRGANQGSTPEVTSGRGDYRGATRNAGEWGNRQPINDPAIESALNRGKWWHDSSQTNLCCRSADCGSKQEIPFCQGCGQHHHGREWCYKKNDEGFNATGYWSENRKGRAPLLSREGRAYGAPPARINHMDANGTGDPPGQGLA